MEALPQRLVELEAELAQCHAAMADPTLYRQDPAEIVKAKTRLQSLEREVAEAYRRWEELEALRGQGG